MDGGFKGPRDGEGLGRVGTVDTGADSLIDGGETGRPSVSMVLLDR